MGGLCISDSSPNPTDISTFIQVFSICCICWYDISSDSNDSKWLSDWLLQWPLFHCFVRLFTGMESDTNTLWPLRIMK